MTLIDIRVHQNCYLLIRSVFKLLYLISKVEEKKVTLQCIISILVFFTHICQCVYFLFYFTPITAPSSQCSGFSVDNSRSRVILKICKTYIRNMFLESLQLFLHPPSKFPEPFKLDKPLERVCRAFKAFYQICMARKLPVDLPQHIEAFVWYG